MAIITELINKRHWEKALAIHEMAPSLAFVTAPLLVELLLRFVPWRGIVGLLRGSSILMGILFLLMGREGGRKGKPATPKTMYRILSKPSFRIVSLVFALVVGASDAVYAILPLFLVNDIGLDRPLV